MPDVGPTAHDGSGDISRRQALKRGAVLGGAVLWTTPAFQVLEISEAAAEQPSGMSPGRGPGDVRPQGPARGRWF